MSTMTSTSSTISQDAALANFHQHLSHSSRIVALLGAGLSASSGLPTYTGVEDASLAADVANLRRDCSLVVNATALRRDPATVWHFYARFRHFALRAQPNPAHFALAAFAKAHPGFLAVSQNIDGLSERAGHPESQIRFLHGNVFDLRCADGGCGYLEKGNFQDPICPALEVKEGVGASQQDGGGRARANKFLQEDLVTKHRKILGEQYRPTPPSAGDSRPLKPVGLESAGEATQEKAVQEKATQEKVEPKPADLPTPSPADIPVSELPHCPRCHTSLLRPAVVWFGEGVSTPTLHSIDQYLSQPEGVDLMLVIGTSASVWPAAGYVEQARKMGARIAVVDVEEAEVGEGSGRGRGLREGKDWYFCGGAEEWVPRLLGGVIGGGE